MFRKKTSLGVIQLRNREIVTIPHIWSDTEPVVRFVIGNSTGGYKLKHYLLGGGARSVITSAKEIMFSLALFGLFV